MKIKLPSIHEAKAKIRASYAAGKLARQVYPDMAAMYRVNGAPCAVGVCLTDEEARFLDNCEDDYGISGQIYKGYVIPHAQEEACWWSDLQDAHDGQQWAQFEDLIDFKNPELPL